MLHWLFHVMFNCRLQNLSWSRLDGPWIRIDNHRILINVQNTWHVKMLMAATMLMDGTHLTAFTSCMTLSHVISWQRHYSEVCIQADPEETCQRVIFSHKNLHLSNTSRKILHFDWAKYFNKIYDTHFQELVMTHLNTRRAQRMEKYI